MNPVMATLCGFGAGSTGYSTHQNIMLDHIPTGFNLDNIDHLIFDVNSNILKISIMIWNAAMRGERDSRR
jgi:hypothetical protein